MKYKRKVMITYDRYDRHTEERCVEFTDQESLLSIYVLHYSNRVSLE